MHRQRAETVKGEGGGRGRTGTLAAEDSEGSRRQWTPPVELTGRNASLSPDQVKLRGMGTVAALRGKRVPPPVSTTASPAWLALTTRMARAHDPPRPATQCQPAKASLPSSPARTWLALPLRSFDAAPAATRTDVDFFSPPACRRFPGPYGLKIEEADASVGVLVSLHLGGRSRAGRARYQT